MKTLKKTLGIAAGIGILAASATSVFGSVLNMFTFDENGQGILNGNPVSWAVTEEPISHLSTLTYYLPFATTPGDVLLTEPDPLGNNIVSDIVRFDGQGHVYFFSEREATDVPPFDLADVPLLPNPITPFFSIPEVGPEGNNGALWIPLAGQPGSIPTGAEIQYNIISDVPEPASMLLAGLGGGLLLLLKFRRPARRA